MTDAAQAAEPAPSPAWEARMLLRAARAGTLATVAADGQPFASLVTPACAPDLSILLLVSELSEHTRHMRAEPRCALMVMGAPADTNPQTAPRLTVTGLATPEPDPALKARWVARHPYAGFYAGFGDFSLWRLRPAGGGFVGGFARAHRLSAEDLTADPAAVAAMAEAEASILEHCNSDHAEAMATIAHKAGGDPALPAWRMTACDVDGCDLTSGEQVVRVAWQRPLAEPALVRGALKRAMGAG